MENNYCVIMAGGVGSRFWPLSRTDRPKQFIDIIGSGRSLIQQTFDRFSRICKPEHIFVVTNDRYSQLVSSQLPLIPVQNILTEPFRRNTAPCIAYANFRIQQENPNANIVVTPADHLIVNESEFINNIIKGLEFTAQRSALLTLGIKPNRPETGYGYIQINSTVDKHFKDIRKVKTFTEKPDLEVAKVFYESGEFFWNSGIFLWSLDSITKSFETNLSDVYSLFSNDITVYGTEREKSYISNVYAECRNISIDYGVMEKADNVYVMCVDFGWSDLGTWGSLYEHSTKDMNGNVIQGNNIFSYNTTNSILNFPKDKLVVIDGLEDYIIAESEGVLLICRRQNEQRIRQFVNDVKINKGEKFI